jgi:hypothetical protein
MNTPALIQFERGNIVGNDLWVICNGENEENIFNGQLFQV